MSRDLTHNVSLRRGISPSTVSDNTPFVSQIIDCAGFQSLTWAIALGTIADADATFTVLHEEGDESDLADAAATPDAHLLGTELGASFTFAHDNQTRKLGYKVSKRYARLTITPAANADAATLAAVAVLGHPLNAPQSAQSA